MEMKIEPWRWRN